MKRFLTSLVALVGFAVPAHAVTLDFANMADTLGEDTWNNIHNGPGNWYVQEGLAVRSFGIGNEFSQGYLDAGNAGLGVCSFPNGACQGTPDDNVGAIQNDPNLGFETLVLEFDQVVTLDSLLFRAQNHSLLTGNVTFNSISFQISNGLIVPNPDPLAATAFTGRNFQFFSTTSNDSAFYLSALNAECDGVCATDITPVPIPAPLALFLTGLAGLGWIGRRRRKA